MPSADRERPYASRSERLSAWLSSWKAPVYLALAAIWNVGLFVLAERGDWRHVGEAVGAATYGTVIHALRPQNHGTVRGGA